MRTRNEIKAKLEQGIVDYAKVEDQAGHIRRFPKEAHAKIIHDYYRVQGEIEILEWLLEGEVKAKKEVEERLALEEALEGQNLDWAHFKKNKTGRERELAIFYLMNNLIKLSDLYWVLGKKEEESKVNEKIEELKKEISTSFHSTGNKR